MLKKSKNIFLLKGESKKLRKASSLISRTYGAMWVQNYPLDDKQYFSFQLNDKLVRRLKIFKLQNKLQSKKSISLYTLINKCKRFDTFEEFESFKEKNKKSYNFRSNNITYTQMPHPSKKDNQKLDYEKSEWSKMTKEQLIKKAENINGYKVRKPRKTANKRTWINFLERFSNKRWDEKNYS